MRDLIAEVYDLLERGQTSGPMTGVKKVAEFVRRCSDLEFAARELNVVVPRLHVPEADALTKDITRQVHTLVGSVKKLSSATRVRGG